MLKRKQQQTTLYKVTYKFYEEEVYTTTATSAGLASLDADWCVEILTVEKL